MDCLNQFVGLLAKLSNLQRFVPADPDVPRTGCLGSVGSFNPFHGIAERSLRLLGVPEFVMGHRQEEPVPGAPGIDRWRLLQIGDGRFVIDQRGSSSRRARRGLSGVADRRELRHLEQGLCLVWGRRQRRR